MRLKSQNKEIKSWRYVLAARIRRSPPIIVSVDVMLLMDHIHTVEPWTDDIWRHVILQGTLCEQCSLKWEKLRTGLIRYNPEFYEGSDSD